MTHCTEEQLILHYYGEDGGRPDVERHLAACAECAAEYRAMFETLQLVVAPAVPERDDSYALDVWTRIRTRLPEQAAPWWHVWLGWDRVAVAVAVATVVVAAFVGGRVWPRPVPATVPALSSIDAEAGERVRLAAISDHLERSERVLLDVVNADGDSVDLSTEQAWAADLLDSNRLYRTTASQAEDALVAGVLDELERGLLEVVHGPSTPTPAEFEAVRTRLDADALLFKVRVLADELHEREIAPVQPRKTT
ncbi:MAG: hypothetical protein ABJA98_16730 [Acidobacteriota bacterium]